MILITRGSRRGISCAGTCCTGSDGRRHEPRYDHSSGAARRRGIAAALIDTVVSKCRDLGCSAVATVFPPEGDGRDGLTAFYERLGFVGSNRKLFMRPFAE